MNPLDLTTLVRRLERVEFQAARVALKRQQLVRQIAAAPRPPATPDLERALRHIYVLQQARHDLEPVEDHQPRVPDDPVAV